ncbi:Response regulator [uncultured Gammaproteobacteria bacterium]
MVDFSTLRIVVIDDDAFFRATLRQQLSRLGCTDGTNIVEAGDGAEGLVECARVRPELILCDIAMEPINGLEFISQLRRAEWAGATTVPVIFVTSHSEIDTVRQAARVGGGAFLVKPILLRTLKDKIESLLAKSN